MRRYVWIFMLAFMVTCFVGCEEKNTSVSTESQNSYIQIQMDEAIMMMEEETEYIILDVRTPEEYAEKHIPGAINVPNEMIDENVTLLPPAFDVGSMFIFRMRKCKKKSLGRNGFSC